MSKTIKIGGASGYWGDAMMATPQLLAAGGLDYIVYDYLAEITMSIMARARAQDAKKGYALDFVSNAMRPHLTDIARQKVKILSNAGGVNPQACAVALRQAIQEAGLDLKVACVLGDDLMARKAEFAQCREMFSGEVFPDSARMASINAYLGAFPIAKALGAGADIVITGRSVDSAVTLGACVHAFGWAQDDWDRLAAGSLAGHIIECGPQATGGNYTDWAALGDGIANIGYPIVDIDETGQFTCTKPAGTGGEVSRGTISEQMLYEIGDPQAYLLPDVVCDFSDVTCDAQGKNQVRVKGAKGYPAPATLKVCATFADGWRGGNYYSFVGAQAAAAAHGFADATLARARQSLRQANLADYEETSVEILGAGSQFGADTRKSDATEVVLKLAAHHESDTGIAILLREAAGLGLATPVGLSGFVRGSTRPSPRVRLFSFTLDKTQVPVRIDLGDSELAYASPKGTDFHAGKRKRPQPPARPKADSKCDAVPLRQLAWGRSGDKGDKANIGIIARHSAFMPYIWAQLDEARVAKIFAHFLQGKVERYYLPGLPAINFVLHEVLGGGGVASLRNDPQGKTYAQIVLAQTILLPAALLKPDNQQKG